MTVLLESFILHEDIIHKVNIYILVNPTKNYFHHFTNLLNPPGRNLSAQKVPLGLIPSSSLHSLVLAALESRDLACIVRLSRANAELARDLGDRSERGFGPQAPTPPMG